MVFWTWEKNFITQFGYGESIFGLYFQLFKLLVSPSFYEGEVGMWVLWLIRVTLGKTWVSCLAVKVFWHAWGFSKCKKLIFF